MKRISALLLALLMLALCACDNYEITITPKNSSAKSSSQSVEASSQEVSSKTESVVSSNIVSSSKPVSKSSSKAVSSALASKPTAVVVPEKIDTPDIIADKLEKPKENNKDLTPYTIIASGDYHLYKSLNSAEKEIYDKLASLAETMDYITDDDGLMISKSIELGMFDSAAKGNEFCQKMIKVFRSDNPQIFWLGRHYGFGYNPRTKMATCCVTFSYTKSQRNNLRTKLENKIAGIIEKIGNGLSEYDRELAIFNWLCANVEYDNNAVDEYNSGNINSLDPWTSYGALINGKAVCEGYSRGFQLLMYYVGIQSSLVTGKSKEQPHMWSIARIENAWYQLDVTWADAATSNREFVNYTYFNISDSLMMLDHDYSEDYNDWLNGTAKKVNWNLNNVDPGDFNIFLPSCNSISANYCVKNNLYIETTADANDILGKGLAKAISEGRSSECFMFIPYFNGAQHFNNNYNTINKKYSLNKSVSYIPYAMGITVYW